MTKARDRTPEQKSLDDLGIEAVCDMLRDGANFQRVGKRAGVSKKTVWRWVHESAVREKDVKRALEEAAEAFDQEAEHVLRTMKDVSRARELANHLRWRARARNPRVYSEKHQIGLDDDTLKHLSEEQINTRLRALMGAGGGGSKPDD